MSQANQPTDHQGLFRFAINERRKVIGEFLPRQASWQLWAWAPTEIAPVCEKCQQV